MRRLALALAAILALPLVVVVLVLGTIPGGGQATAVAPSPAAALLPAGQAAAGVSASANQILAADLAAGYGWTAGNGQIGCLTDLWTRESSWSETAKNTTSGAYGIAQALGQVKGVPVALNREGYNYPPPFTAANPPPWGDSDPAAQISWGLGYIKGRYGTPCGAWAHEEADGFYLRLPVINR